MLPQNNPDRIRIIFDDHRLVANAGLLLPATLAQHLGLAELVRQCLDLGNAPGRANTGDKIMTLVASALAGGDCIDDADALRTGGTACTLGSTVKAPSTLGTFLRSFRWGHVRQLDRVSRELLARAWAAGAGPGDAPFTIDLDPPSARPTGWPRRARDTTATPAPVAITRCWPLPPALATYRWPGYARAPGQHHPRRRPLPARDGGTSALRRRQGPTHGAGRQRLLCPRHRRRLPQDGCPLLHHHPPAQKPAPSHRGHTRDGLDAHPLLDGRRRRCGRDHLHSL